MDCLLERSYHLRMDTPTAVDAYSILLSVFCLVSIHNYTEMYSEHEIQNLDDLKAEPERSSWRRDEKVNADSETTIICKNYVELFGVKVNLKVFALFVFVLFNVIQVKRQKI